MKTKSEDLQVCHMCFMLMEIGEVPSEEEEGLQAELDAIPAVQEGAKRLRSEGYTYTGNDTAFSWSTCDCCGNQLGGTRYEYRS